MRVTRAILAVSATTFLLVACGGGGDAPARATLEGVAAVGAPLAGATVQARCAGGTSVTPVQTGASGAWSLTVPQAALPCALQASGGNAGGAANTLSLHSIATSAGTVNITPLTDLVLALAAGTDPAGWYSEAGASQLKAAAAQVQDAVTRALAALEDAGFTVPDALDVLAATFEAAAGDPYDDLLEALAAALAGDGGSHASLVASWVAAGNNPLPVPEPAAGGAGGGGSGDGAALDGANGATASFGNTRYTYTANVGWLVNPVNNLGQFAAFKPAGASFDAITRWDIRNVPASPGSYSCGGSNGTSIQLALAGQPHSTGVQGGNCTIEVLEATGNRVTGRFSAVFPGLGETTDGYFQLAASTGTPGGAGAAGGSFRIAGTTYTFARAVPAGFEEFAGVTIQPTESGSPGYPLGVQIHTVPNAPGTYACGSGNAWRHVNVWFWWDGKWYYAGNRTAANGEGPSGSSCSITVQTASGTPVGTSLDSYQNGTFAGTFSGTFVTADGSSSISVTNGSFRYTHPVVN